MITIFSTCKPFTDKGAAFRQINAIRSWLLTTKRVFLFGDDEGVGDVAKEFGCIHIPDVQCNKQGRPLISAMFRQVQWKSQTPFYCYINADNLAAGLDDAFTIIGRKFKRFMFTGRRWDWARPVPLEEVTEESPSQIMRTEEGCLDTAHGMEYFGFTGGQFLNLAPFAVGWPGWDNSLMVLALKKDLPVIDATGIVNCVHQRHPVHWRSHRNDPQCVENIRLMHRIVPPGDKRGRTKSAPWKIVDGRLKRRKGG